MGVQQPARGATPAVTMIDVRAVRVARPIGEPVVLAMVGHPRDDWTLDRRRAEDREHRTEHAPSLECPVGKQAVKADRHAETRQHVQHKEVEDVIPAQQAVPQLPSNEEQAEDRHGGHDPRDHPVATLADNKLNIIATD